MALPPTPLVDLVLWADLVVVAEQVTLLATVPEPEKRPPLGWTLGMPAPPGWSPSEPGRLLEVTVDRVLLGESSSPEPSRLIVISSAMPRSGSEGQLFFLRALPEPGHYAARGQTPGYRPYSEDDVTALAERFWPPAVRTLPLRSRLDLLRRLRRIRRRRRTPTLPPRRGSGDHSTGVLRRPERPLPRPLPLPERPPHLDPDVVLSPAWQVDHPSSWLLRPRQPHQWVLRSGRVVVAEGDEIEPWIRVELADGLVAELDLSELDRNGAGPVELLLHWWPGPRAAAHGVDGEATVRHGAGGDGEAGGPHFTVVPAPAGDHGRVCECRSDERDAQFRTWVEWSEVGRFLDVLAALPRDARVTPISEEGIQLWRGRRDRDGRAVVEHFPARGDAMPGTGVHDARAEDRRTVVVTAVDVGLPAPLPERAVAVSTP